MREEDDMTLERVVAAAVIAGAAGAGVGWQRPEIQRYLKIPSM